MGFYELKKNLGNFKPGSEFEGNPTQELNVLDQDKNKVNRFVKVLLSNKEYFAEIKSCESCGQRIKEV